jgi:K+-sensing histidine kinase KdpD
MASTASEDRNDSVRVLWVDTVRLIRQLSHDLRNHLNAIELQSAYISELDGDAEMKREIKRLRENISRLTAILQKLSAGVGEVKPNLISYRASDFGEDLHKKIQRDFPTESAEVKWEVEAGDSVLNIDPQLLEQAFIELFVNAFQHERGQGALVAAAGIDKKRFVFSLREPKAQFELSTEKWGREPLRKISQGHYGLGLNRVRVIIEAHGGELRAHYDGKASILVTTITLPLLREEG